MNVTILRLFVAFPLLTGTAFGQAAAINGEISGTVIDPSEASDREREGRSRE